MLENGRSPSRKVGELDNRGSHFYLALYWAQELASQTEDVALAEAFAALADELAAYQDKIVEELYLPQGRPVDLGGYYRPDPARVAAVMRPSATLNAALARSARQRRVAAARPATRPSGSTAAARRTSWRAWYRRGSSSRVARLTATRCVDGAGDAGRDHRGRGRVGGGLRRARRADIGAEHRDVGGGAGERQRRLGRAVEHVAEHAHRAPRQSRPRRSPAQRRDRSAVGLLVDRAEHDGAARERERRGPAPRGPPSHSSTERPAASATSRAASAIVVADNAPRHGLAGIVRP